MNINDLRKFIAIAQCNHLSLASERMNQTPAALSKVIKRLEDQLNTRLFDRIGRNIRLNRNGQKLLDYAVNLIHEADQVISEFSGDQNIQNINISGPSILVHYWLPQLIEIVDHRMFRFDINVIWEGDALSYLSSGQADLALVTQYAADQGKSQDFQSLKLLDTTFCVVAAPFHPVIKECNHNGEISCEKLVRHDFVSPTVSPFCGVNRGDDSDGWKHKEIKRKLTYRCNDFSVLLSLVEQGLALAYVPDFVANTHQFTKISIKGLSKAAKETIQLVYKPSMSYGWLNRIIEDCATITKG